MKVLLKILLFVFVALITNVSVTMASVTFSSIQTETNSFSFHKEMPEIAFKVVENDLENCCQSEQYLVAYENWDITVEASAAKTSSNVLLNTSRQLQAKFKHAGDFGVVGNYSKANAGKFSSAINQHINSAGVQTIQGTYKGQSVIHYVNPSTGSNVISSPIGQFISGWKLNPAQLQNVLKHGGYRYESK